MNLRTQDIVKVYEQTTLFADRLAEVGVLFRPIRCVFAEPGWDQAQLLVDGEWVAQRRRHVLFRPEGEEV